MKKKIFSHILCVFLVLISSCLMPLFLFFQNIGVVKFYEIAVFMGLFSFVGLIVFVILRFVLKSEYKAGISATLFSLAFQNAGRLTKLMPYKFVLLVFVLIIGALIFAVWKFLKDDWAKLFVPILSVAFALMLILNIVTSLGTITAFVKSKSEIKSDLNNQYEYIRSFKKESSSSETLPNVYLIIPDEYSGFNALSKFYDYDNAEFENFLKDHNFTISKSSTNYMRQTYECLANAFNMEVSEKNRYKNTSVGYCEEKTAQSVLFRLAEEEGYNINVAQSSELVNYESKTDIYGDKWSKTANNDSIIDLMTKPSLLAPFTGRIRAILNGVSVDYFTGQTAEVIFEPNIAPLKYFSNEESVGKERSFNLCYSNAPHIPFAYDENGNLLEDLNHQLDWGEKSYYLNQLKYCTTQMQAVIDNIIENDPDSIIIVMSDHGARDHSSEVENAQWMSEMTTKDITDILCAVYYQGEEFTDIEGMCGSNVLISVVNKAWGYDIPLIEQSDDMYYKAP